MAKDSLRNDVDVDAKSLLQLIAKCDEIEQAPALRHVDEQVEITGAVRLARRTEPNTRTFWAP